MHCVVVVVVCVVVEVVVVVEGLTMFDTIPGRPPVVYPWYDRRTTHTRYPCANYSRRAAVGPKQNASSDTA